MKNNVFKSIGVALLGILGLIYILNPTAGIIEIIPDAIPIIGNLDEAAAVTLILTSLRYFGVDLTSFFKRKKNEVKK